MEIISTYITYPTKSYIEDMYQEQESFDKCMETKVIATTKVISQLQDVIKGLYPNIPIKVYGGQVKEYGKQYNPTYMIVGDEDNIKCLKITPTLSEDVMDSIEVRYFIQNCNVNNILMSDIDLMNEIGKLQEYLEGNEMPNFGINKVSFWAVNQYMLHFGQCAFKMYDTQIVLMYHCIAREANNKFGTNYPYSQQVIDNLYKHKEFTNLRYLGFFCLVNGSDNSVTLKEIYYYEDGNAKQPTFQNSQKYGTWTKQEIMELLDTLYPYVRSNYFYITSDRSMTRQYAFYDRIGIGYTNKPNYFNLLLWQE